MNPTELELDSLREVVSISASHASIALSEMANKKIDVSFPWIKPYKIEKIPSLISKPHELVSTVYLHVEGKHENKKFPVGSLLLVFPKESAIGLANLVQEKNDKELNEIGKDSLKETGNILAGAFTNILTEMLNFSILESLPDLCFDYLNSTLDSVLAHMGSKANQALVFKTEFSIEEHEIKSFFLMIFEKDVFDLLVKKIKEIKHG